MITPITISLHSEDKTLFMAIKGFLSVLPAVTLVTWHPKTQASPPDILILEDNMNGAIFSQLTSLKKHCPQTALFVISENKDPKHIIEVMKKGGCEYLLKPLVQEQFVKAVEEVRSTISTNLDQGTGVVYSFISSKGGLGTTVLAVNTAAALSAQTRENIALWDMSFQSGDSLVLLDLLPKRTIIDLCQNIERLDFALLKNVMAAHDCGVSLLAAPKQPEESEEIEAPHVNSILTTMATFYDTVIIDCASMSITPATVAAFNLSEKIFIVIDLSIPAVRNASRISKLIRQVGIDADKIEFIVNRFAEGSSLPLSEVEKSVAKKIFWIFPNDYKEVVKSINSGSPAVLSEPGSDFSKNVVMFTEKLKQPVQYHDLNGVGQKGFWGRLFS